MGLVKGRAWETTGRHYPSRAELGSTSTWVVRMVAELPWGWLGPGEGWPLFDVLVDVELGAWVGVGP